MRSITLLATALLLPVAAPAQDLLADVNQDVLNGLIFQARNEARATVTRTLPAELSRLEIPDQLDLIGTAVRADGNHVTAFRTSQPAGQAFDLLLGALTADGWEVEMQQGMPMQQTFNAPTQIQASMICRAGERRGVMVRDAGEVRMISISGSVVEPRPRPCHAPLPGASTTGPGGFASLNRHMPRFDFPAGVRVLGGGGGGGSNDYFRAATRIQSPEEPASALALILSRQLTAQGWTRDAAWNGALGAGTNWTRRSDDGLLAGTLEVLDRGDGFHEVAFTVLLAQ